MDFGGGNEDISVFVCDGRGVLFFQHGAVGMERIIVKYGQREKSFLKMGKFRR